MNSPGRTSLPGEARVILEILRSDGRCPDATLPGQSMDWEKLFGIVKRNRLLPLFYTRGRSWIEACGNQRICEKFEQAFQETCAYNDRNMAALRELNALLTDAGIEVVVFKGMLFAEHIYGSRNLREKCDLDLLVRPESFLQTLDLLIRQGFQQEYFGHAQVSTRQAQLIKREEQISVDLHYGLTPQYQLTYMDEAISGSHLQPEQWNRGVGNRTYWFFQLDLEPVWARTRVQTSGDSDFRVLSDEDSFLVAFIHGFKENWRYFIRFCDLAEIIVKKPDLDWVFLMQEAHRLRASRKLALALRLLVDHLGARLPQDVLKFTRRNSSACLAREIVLRRLAPRTQEGSQEFRRVVSVLTMDSMRDTVRYLCFVKRTPQDPFGHRVSRYGFIGFLLKVLKVGVATRFGAFRQ